MIGVISYTPIVEIDLGPLAISPHGLFIAIGFIIGAQFMLPTSRRKGMADDLVYPLFTRAAIGAIIGSRLAFVLNHIGDYLNPLEILRVWEGGISLLGGIIGAILLAVPRMRSQGLSFWKVMDAAMPGLALGIVVGRTGDLIIADHLGKVTDFFLGYRCPAADIATGSPCIPGTIVHQTALYDQLLAGVLLLVLLWLRRSPRYDGFITMVFALGYGMARLTEDFLREDVRRLGLTGSQWTALTVMALSLYGLAVLRRTPRWGNWDAPAATSPLSSTSAPPLPAESAASPSLSAEGGEGKAPEPPPVRSAASQSVARQPVVDERDGPPEEGDGSGDPDRRDSVTEGDRD